MKTLYESLLNNTRGGMIEEIGGYIEKHIPKFGEYSAYFNNITFKEFLDYVTPKQLEDMFKKPFKDSKLNSLSAIGTFEMQFKDGNFGLEIIKLNFMSSRHNNVWWREAYVDNSKNSAKDAIRSYNFPKYFENSTFSTGWGDRLKDITPKYLNYLKEKYKDLK